MEARRGQRVVIDPKVRQVGFVTPCPGSDSDPIVAQSTTTLSTVVVSTAISSPSPVIIPPARIAEPPKAAPMPVPSPPSAASAATRRMRDRDGEAHMPMGSYNPVENVLATSVESGDKGSNSDMLGSSLQTDAIDDLGSSVMSKLNGSLMDLSMGSGSPQSVSTQLSVVAVGKGLETQKPQLPSVVVENNVITLISTAQVGDAMQGGIGSGISQHQAEADKSSKSTKEKTTKAERRALQEAQRAAKAAAKETGANKGDVNNSQKEGKKSLPQKKESLPQKKESLPDKKPTAPEKKPALLAEKKSAEKAPEKDKRKDVPAPRMQFDDEQRVAKAKRRSLVEQTETKNRVELFRHLPQFKHSTQLALLEAKFLHNDMNQLHPAVYQVGLQYLKWDIVGGNARCVALLMAFKEMIKDYSTPPEKVLTRDLTARINSHVSFLTTCRPLSISMGNAIKFLKAKVAKIPVALSEPEAKSLLITQIDTFIQEKIVLADKEIVKHAMTKIKDGDVILTHGSSCVVEMILIHAHEIGKKFRVVVLDSRPRLEGRGLLRRLYSKGIECTYTHINAASYIMEEVTRVFLGAASVLSNGAVYSRVGTACVAMTANAFRVPVMICCETYKFHERVQLDSICSNELGDPDALTSFPTGHRPSVLEGWSENEHLQLLNLTYDATPSDYVSGIITELGTVPPTSVPVILREYRKEPIMI